MPALGNSAVALEGASGSDVLLMTNGDGDSSAHGTVVCDILGASDGEVILRTNENMGNVLGGIPIGGGVNLSAGDLPDDDITNALLGNCITVVLASNDLGGVAI
jgi:hypothetical protein